jgi:hypothetical protein
MKELIIKNNKKTNQSFKVSYPSETMCEQEVKKILEKILIKNSNPLNLETFDFFMEFDLKVFNIKYEKII